MIERIKKEPALVSAFVTLLGAVLGVFIKNPAMVAALVTAAGFFLGVRQVVTPVTTAAENITKAATQAATDTVKALNPDIVGTTGHITKAATDIVNNTVDNVVGGILNAPR
jgi:hypothetical protein